MTVSMILILKLEKTFCKTDDDDVLEHNTILAYTWKAGIWWIVHFSKNFKMQYIKSLNHAQLSDMLQALQLFDHFKKRSRLDHIIT